MILAVSAAVTADVYTPVHEEVNYVSELINNLFNVLKMK